MTFRRIERPMDGGILIVEDNRAVREGIRLALKREGYAALTAFDGIEGRALLEESPPDALITGLRLPLLSGVELIRHAKTLAPNIVVLALVGRDEETLAQEALRSGADDIVKKSAVETTLPEVLGRALHRARWRHEVSCRVHWPGEGLEERQGRVFLDAPAALLVIDRAGAVRMANRAAAKLLGRAPEALLRLCFEELVAEEGRSRFCERLHLTGHTQRDFEGEVVFLHGDGGPIPAHVVAVEGPQEDEFIIHLIDLTHQKALDREFAESRRLAGLGRVVEGVAHEVRNPMAAIGGFAHFLLKHVGLTEESHEYLEKILKEAERLEKMVKEIEQYALFTRERPHAFGPVDVGNVVARAAERVRERFPNRAVRAKIDRDGEKVNVYGVESLLVDLFEGIVENSYDAMPDGGDLDIRVAPGEGWIKVIVTDTGMGIPEEEIEALFDPFYTKKSEGTGLGLARAHLIAEDHGGHIRFVSRVGEGTVCTVLLPLERRTLFREAGA